jgi:NAD(P)-dependent dehydrogenase (short-subunit alcohol dehydrogenase family)
MKDFKGKVAAITGGGSGMGQELAWQLSARGCHISICDISKENMERTLRGCAPDVKATMQLVDVADREQVNSWAKNTLRDHGKVNIIINNAGTAQIISFINSQTTHLFFVRQGVSTMDSFDNLNDDNESDDLWANFDWVMKINFDGVVNGCRAFLPLLKATDDAYLLNTSSVFGFYTVGGQSAYHASKFAVKGLTEGLIHECRSKYPHIKVACIHPGHVGTNIAKNARVNLDDIKSNPRAAAMLKGKDKSDEALVEGLSEMQERFRTSATTTAKQAATIIIEGIESESSRILVGPDAYGFDWLVRAFPRGYMDPYLKIPLHLLFILPPTVIKRAYNYFTGQDSTVIGAVRDPDAVQEETSTVKVQQLEMEPASAWVPRARL